MTRSAGREGTAGPALVTTGRSRPSSEAAASHARIPESALEAACHILLRSCARETGGFGGAVGPPAKADAIPAPWSAPSALDVRDLVRRGQEAARGGDQLTAYQLLVQATEIDPLHEEAWLWRAGTAERDDEALRCLECVLALNPGNVRAHLGMREVGGRAGHETEADFDAEAVAPGLRRRGRGRSFLYTPLSLLVAAMLSLPFQVARPAAAAEERPTVYRVVPGDTVYGIAFRHGLTVAEMQAANRLPNPDYIVPGQELLIPRRPAGAALASMRPAAGAESAAGARRPAADLADKAGDALAAASTGGPSASAPRIVPVPPENMPWVAVHRATGLWSGPQGEAELFRRARPGAHFQLARSQDGPRLYVWDPATGNYAYVDASDVGPAGGPPAVVEPLTADEPRPAAVDPGVTIPTGGAVVDGNWVAVHRTTGVWSGPDDGAELFRRARPGAYFQVALPQQGNRLYVWDPTTEDYAYVDADAVGPAPTPTAEQLKQAVANIIWTGRARVTMYTCVELGGCNRTASGIWPYEGVVAVDPRVIPLGSTVWLEGLGNFLAADTGGGIKGNAIDVFVHDYHRAIQWGVRYLDAVAYGK